MILMEECQQGLMLSHFTIKRKMTKNEGTNEEETEQKYTKFKTSHNAWTLFKIAVIGAQPKYFSESKETLAKSRKRPT